ncbi:HK97-gp10 family putative phage morphogenesis protein [Emcibacter sp.]|uniref:HK97-gp10 family putative phage morphogenesis protein n=1 Tax=Emcibacter sp. TaxID=1979954 RepID=UPI002AA70E34|nr:HK97-gp10 family putative phage morphogenesis protein [Emcibacter sp.]
MLEGQERLRVGLAEARRTYEDRLMNFVENMAADIAAGARDRVYRNKKSADTHSPLAESIMVVQKPRGADVTTSVSYAPYVEFGTQKMPARPFLTPATEEVKVLFELSPETFGAGQ